MFDSLAYSPMHPGTQQFLQNQLSINTQMLTDAGSRFMSKGREIYERISGSEAARLARAASRAVRSIWQRDEIRELMTVGEFQHAPNSMQRFIMANETIRRLFQQQRCDGYSETYMDTEPGAIGEAHYDYRRATNGMVMEAADGSFYATTYFDDLLEEDRELMLDEQIDIQHSWSRIVEMVRRGGEDPTSRFNADL